MSEMKVLLLALPSPQRTLGTLPASTKEILGLKSVLIIGCQEAHWKAGHKLKCKEFKLNSSQKARSNFGFKPSGGEIKSFSSIALAPACGVYSEARKDAHEFMRFAIDTMQSVCLDEFGEEKVVEPASQETTIIQHIFGGRLQSQECLDQFIDKEWLHGENMYKCNRCNNYVKAWKRLTIQRAPNVLTIALKRFQKGRYGKLNKRVTFPEMMSEGGDGADVYKLYAVVVHVDMLNASFFGHYICYTKDFHGNWHRIDDNKVSSLN
uniref:USP domain-containing protein n=1 Tax=Salix viminalis TaxID=40686 RepID=A0A6N2N2D6_SALVM